VNRSNDDTVILMQMIKFSLFSDIVYTSLFLKKISKLIHKQRISDE